MKNKKIKFLIFVIIACIVFNSILVIPLFNNKSCYDIIRNTFLNDVDIDIVASDIDWENNTSPFYWDNFTLPDNGFGVESYNDSVVNSSYFWHWVSKYVKWDCWGWNPNTDSWQNTYQGVPLKGNYFFINHTRDDMNLSEKLSLAINPPFMTRYRFGLAIDSRVTNFVNRSGQYEYGLTVPIKYHNSSYNIFFNWSDIIIHGWNEYLSFKHGFKNVGGNSFFYFVMTTDVNLNVDRWYELDPYFGWYGTGNKAWAFSSHEDWVGTKFHFESNFLDQYAYNITAYVSCELLAPCPNRYIFSLYYADNGTLVDCTEYIQPGCGVLAYHWYTAEFDSPVRLINDTDYVIVCWSHFGNIKYKTYLSDGWLNNTDFGCTQNSCPPSYIGNAATIFNGRNNYYSIYCTYDNATANNVPEIGAISIDNAVVGYGYNVTINASVWDNDTGLTSVKCNVTYPDDTYYNFTMINTVDEYWEKEINLTDIWQLGWYNYTIFASDGTLTNTSDMYSFNVSAQMNVIVRTTQDDYTNDDGYVNITYSPIGETVFGYTGDGDGNYGTVATVYTEYLRGFKISPDYDGVAISLSARLRETYTGGDTHVKFGIYDAITGSLLNITNEVTVSGSSFVLYTGTLITPVSINSNGIYYIEVFGEGPLSGETLIDVNKSVSGYILAYKGASTYPVFPDPWSPNLYYNWAYCLYCSYITSTTNITNIGSTSNKGFLLMSVEYNNSGTWVLQEETINETSSRTINSGDILNLSGIFNGNVVPSVNLTYGSGMYRVYVAFRDPFYNVLLNDDDTYMNASYSFNYTMSVSVKYTHIRGNVFILGSRW